MAGQLQKHIKPIRFQSIPAVMRQDLLAARKKRHWSQTELGAHAGLPQMHISGIESGKIVPRFDTLLDLVRVLDYDLILVPRSLVPAVQALIRDQQHATSNAVDDEERPLYALAGSQQDGDES